MQVFRRFRTATFFLRQYRSVAGVSHFRSLDTFPNIITCTPRAYYSQNDDDFVENGEINNILNNGGERDSIDDILGDENQSFGNTERDRMKYITELYSVYRISFFTSLGIVTIIVMLVIIFRKYLSRKLSKEVAEIGSKTLDEEKLKKSANALSRKLISEILSDEEITNLSLVFLQNLFEQEDLRKTVLEVLQNLLADEEVRGQCQKILVNTWSSITNDPASLDHTSNFFGRIFNSNEVKLSVEKLFVTIFNEESMKNETAKFYSDVLEQSVFRDRFFVLTQNTLNKVIIQKYTQENAKKFIKQILDDEEMKREASQFLFDAAKLMITPKWFQSTPEKKDVISEENEEGISVEQMEIEDEGEVFQS